MWLRLVLAVLLLFFTTACSTDDPNRHNTFIPLTAIAVSAAYDSMADKTVNQYTAIGDFSGAFTRDITTEVSWRVDNKKIASVSTDSGSEGLVTAISSGETSVTARYEDISGSASVIVTTAFLTGIAITPEDEELQIGITQQYSATGTFSDASTQDITGLATWESSDTGVATIDSSGLATTNALGSTSISGAWDGIQSSTGLIVTDATLTTIAIIPEQATIAQGTTEQFTADGTYSDNTTLDITDIVDWKSSDTGIGVISADGLATGVAPGEVEISASFEVEGSDTISATSALTVTNAVIESIIVAPENSIIEEGESQQFSATGTFSDDNEQDITELGTWRTINNTVGTISNSPNSKGLFVSIDSGTTIIEATFDGVSGETLLTIE